MLTLSDAVLQYSFTACSAIGSSKAGCVSTGSFSCKFGVAILSLMALMSSVSPCLFVASTASRKRSSSSIV